MLKHTKKIAGFLSLSLLFACQSIDEKKAEQQPDDKQKSAQTDRPKAHRASLSGLSGLYFARLPCPECGSVRVNLILEANGSYDKTEEFKDNDDVYFESGTWTLHKMAPSFFPQLQTVSRCSPPFAFSASKVTI